MRLYGSPASPFVRKVRVVLHETGLADRVAFVLASGTALDPGTMPLALNPLGKVPCLERPDGPARQAIQRASSTSRLRAILPHWAATISARRCASGRSRAS